jgi:hypothetical protein
MATKPSAPEIGCDRFDQDAFTPGNVTGTNRELVVAGASLPSRAFTSILSMKISASMGASLFYGVK